MGTNNVELKNEVIATNNIRYGLNADGSKEALPFMSNTEYYMMGGMGLFTVATQGRQLINKPTWTFADGSQQQISRMKYGAKMFKANFGTWNNFNNMEFIETKVSQIEGILSKNTPQLPKDFSGSQKVKDLFEQLQKAKNPREYSRIVEANQKTYAKLQNILRRKAPSELAKLQNVAKYNQMYGGVLEEFKQAQTQMRNCKPLQNGTTISGLHEKFAKARLQENEFLRGVKGKQHGKVGFRAKAGAKMTGMTKNALASSKAFRAVSRGVGKAGGALIVVMSAATVAMDVTSAVKNAPEGKKWRDGSRQALKSGARAGLEIGGAWAGMKIGATIGAFAGPVGAAIGGLVGSFVGWAAGAFVANKSKFINTSVIEERQAEQRKQENEAVEKAIENKDVETVWDYTSQFKEQVVDEKGNPVTDEEGNPVLQYVRISEDDKEQKAFEERIAKLDNFVMTEAAKQLETEALHEEIRAVKGDDYEYGITEDDLFVSNGYGPRRRRTDATPSTDYVSAGYDWTNKAWQNSLEDKYNSNNYYSFDPSNYSMFWQMNAQNGKYNFAA